MSRMNRRRFCRVCVSYAGVMSAAPLGSLSTANAQQEDPFGCATEMPDFFSELNLQSTDEPSILDVGEAPAQTPAWMTPQGVAYSNLRWKPRDGLEASQGKIRLGVAFSGRSTDSWKSEVETRAMHWLEGGTTLANVITFEFGTAIDKAQIVVGQGGIGGRPAANKSLVGRAAKFKKLEDGVSTMFIFDLSSTEHEFGHALCLGHEHQHEAIPVRIDPQKAIAYYADRYGWSEGKTLENVFSPVQRCDGDLGFNPESVMLYPIPPQILEEPDTRFFRHTQIHERDRKCVEHIYGVGRS